MTESKTAESVQAEAGETCNKVDQCVRHHPGTALAFAIGAGVLVGVLAHALRPRHEPTTKERLVRLLEDFEARLRDVTEPAISRATTYATDTAGEISDGFHQCEAGFERILHNIGTRLRRLF